MRTKSYFEQLIDLLKAGYKALDIDKYFPDTVYKLAIKYYKQGDFQKAESYFLKCLEVNGIYSLPVEQRANCASFLAEMYHKGKQDKITTRDPDIFLDLAAKLSDNPLYQRNAGGYFLNQGLYDKAFPYLIKCLESGYQSQFTSKDKADCAHRLGVLHVIKDSGFFNPEKAVEYHKLSIELNPKEPVYQTAYLIAMERFVNKQTEEIVQTFNKHTEELVQTLDKLAAQNTEEL